MSLRLTESDHVVRPGLRSIPSTCPVFISIWLHCLSRISAWSHCLILRIRAVTMYALFEFQCHNIAFLVWLQNIFNPNLYPRSVWISRMPCSNSVLITLRACIFLKNPFPNPVMMSCFQSCFKSLYSRGSQTFLCHSPFGGPANSLIPPWSVVTGR